MVLITLAVIGIFTFLSCAFLIGFSVEVERNKYLGKILTYSSIIGAILFIVGVIIEAA